MIIDEEQKFGVAAKEKLKQIRTTVDSLTLTATPIPRTLQFSLMGARDLSIINTPPPNRQPIQTEVHVFNEDVIRDAIYYETERGGQVFFIHNRVHGLREMTGIDYKDFVLILVLLMRTDKWKAISLKKRSLILWIENMMCWFAPILLKAVLIFQM